MNDWVVFSSSNSFSSFSCFTCSGSRVFSPFPFPRIFSSNDFRVSGRLKRSNDLKTTFGLATGFWKSEEPESEGCSRFSFGAFRRLERPGSLMEDSFTDSSGGGVVVWAFCEAASRNLIETKLFLFQLTTFEFNIRNYKVQVLKLRFTNETGLQLI